MPEEPLKDSRHYGALETRVDRGGMGLHYSIKVNGVQVWAHAFAMDGPIDPEMERVFRSLHLYGVTYMP